MSAQQNKIELQGYVYGSGSVCKILTNEWSYKCTTNNYFLCWVLNSKQNYSYLKKHYNYGHSIMRTFDVLPNFPFTTSETKADY